MSVVLTVQLSSTTKEYTLYAKGGLQVIFRFKRASTGCELFTQTADAKQTSEQIKPEHYDDAAGMVASHVATFRESHRLPAVDTVVLAVCVPGTVFQKHTEINDTYISELKTRQTVLPQIVPALLQNISDLKKLFPAALLLAASDTAFYTTLPTQARNFSFSNVDSKEYDLHRFGSVGLSVASVVRRVPQLVGQKPERVLVCHIGSQVNITAIKNGRAVDYSTGYSGADIDCATLLKLMHVKNLRPTEAELYLKTNSGLMGMAGEKDFRQLLERKAQTNQSATVALTHFSYHVQKSLGANIVSLGGVDTLVLTGSAATRSPELRELLLSGLSPMGIQINPERNESLTSKEGVLSKRTSPVKVVVMKSDEAGEMLLIAKQFDQPNK